MLLLSAGNTHAFLYNVQHDVKRACWNLLTLSNLACYLWWEQRYFKTFMKYSIIPSLEPFLFHFWMTWSWRRLCVEFQLVRDSSKGSFAFPWFASSCFFFPLPLSTALLRLFFFFFLCRSLAHNHRITEYLKLEGTHMDHHPTPDYTQD